MTQKENDKKKLEKKEVSEKKKDLLKKRTSRFNIKLNLAGQ